MRYEEPLPIELSEAEAAVHSGDPSSIADVLLRASLSAVDPQWVEAASLSALARPESAVKWAALLALAHLVRRYGHLNTEAVQAAVIPLRDDPRLAGRVDDLMDDIQIFLVK